MAFHTINWEIIASITELLAVLAAVVAIWIGVRQQRQNHNVDLGINLSSDFRERWEGGWGDTLTRIESCEFPMNADDARQVRYMLNWVNWVGTFIQGNMLANQQLILGPGSLQQAFRRILEAGRPLIKTDVAKFGPEIWADLRPICEVLNVEGIDKLLAAKHQQIFMELTPENTNRPSQPVDMVASLKRYWPEPGNQLHAGGWRTTDWLIRRLKISAADQVLDVCCGEGASAVWVSRITGANVTGVDRLESAIEVANATAQKAELATHCTFEAGELTALPFSNGQFSVIYGQDPDGLATDDVDA